VRRIALLGVIVALAACGGAAPANPVAIGATAPEYAARTLAGDSVALSAMRGKVVVLNVWATWCHPCRQEIPQLQALHTTYAERGLAVVGVSVDAAGTEDGIREFAKEFAMTYPIWLDPDERVSSRFLTMGVPETFIIDRTGVIRWHRIGALQDGDASLKAAIARALDG
jgi:cytochrome c biogenesis protein CcmG/thiol:disulfide interchange protein DsbE